MLRVDHAHRAVVRSWFSSDLTTESANFGRSFPSVTLSDKNDSTSAKKRKHVQADSIHTILGKKLIQTFKARQQKRNAIDEEPLPSRELRLRKTRISEEDVAGDKESRQRKIRFGDDGQEVDEKDTCLNLARGSKHTPLQVKMLAMAGQDIVNPPPDISVAASLLPPGQIRSVKESVDENEDSKVCLLNKRKQAEEIQQREGLEDELVLKKSKRKRLKKRINKLTQAMSKGEHVDEIELQRLQTKLSNTMNHILEKSRPYHNVGHRSWYHLEDHGYTSLDFEVSSREIEEECQTLNSCVQSSGPTLEETTGFNAVPWKRKKIRSRQKNIRKDNRPDHLKPPHLRASAQEDKSWLHSELNKRTTF